MGSPALGVFKSSGDVALRDVVSGHGGDGLGELTGHSWDRGSDFIANPINGSSRKQ